MDEAFSFTRGASSLADEAFCLMHEAFGFMHEAREPHRRGFLLHA